MSDSSPIHFRWRYLSIPLVLLGLTVILTGIFFAGLPDELVWTFTGDGLPAKVSGRTSVIAWILGLQFVFTIGALLITRITAAAFQKYVQSDSGALKPSMILSLMGNIPAVPQAVIFFTMLDIFSYNSYAIHLLPLWLNALIIMIAGGIIMGVFFFRGLLQLRKVDKE
jgi:hypothetical protein